MRVIVIGARGFIGQKIVSALERVNGLEIVQASRSGAFAIDLEAPATFDVLRGGDVLIDASASSRARPDALARACLERGASLLVTSSDRPLVERLLTDLRDMGGPGRVILGAGIFTGVSNALAAAAASALPGATELELAVASSPFSGAGEGTVELMVDSLTIPARRVVDGAWVDAPSISAGPMVVFPTAARRTLEVPLAEPAMVAASTRVPNVRMYFAPKPALLRASFLMLPSALVRRAAFRWFMRAYFSLLRRALLRNVASSVDILATARGGGREATASLSVTDGMAALGVSVAATVEHLAAQPARTGTSLIDEVVTAEDLRARMTRLAPPDLGMRWSLPAAQPA